MIEIVIALLIGTPMLVLLEPWKPLAHRDTNLDARFCFSCREVCAPEEDESHGLTCVKCGAAGPVELSSESVQSYFTRLRV